MKQREEGLKRYIGLFGLTANIVNIIVGAGIFVIPAIIAEKMGSTSIVAYLFCGVLVALIMLCFAEAGSKVTDTGGGFAYVEAAFGKYPGFLMAVIALVASILSDAAVANALVDILGASFTIFTLEGIRIIFFAVVFFGLATINIIGIKQGIGLVKTLTLLKLAPLFLLIFIGLPKISISNLVWESAPTFKQIGETSLILFFAFQGGDVGLTIGGEIKNPKKTIPKAIFIGILTVLIIYILIQTITQGILGENLANFKEAPLAETAKIILGPIGFTILFIGASVSMFGNLTGEILNNPRMLFALARDKVIPVKKLSLIHPKFKTPYTSILLYAAIGFLIAVFGVFKQLIVFASAGALIYYLGVVLTIFKLRSISKKEPDEFEIPGGLLVPIMATIIILYFLSNLDSKEIIGIGVFMGILTVIYGGILFFKKNN
jgi:amino acid transporter